VKYSLLEALTEVKRLFVSPISDTKIIFTEVLHVAIIYTLSYDFYSYYFKAYFSIVFVWGL